ncbi:MAG: 30S ribosomal protein S6 [Planctomycetota bacterium]|nr:30S ribosomal protein S6 [Planctomycetota bacterium]
MPTYEGMFLIDNDAVRAGWSDAKAVVTNALEKHGGTVRTARRWDERRLAYPVKGRNRATYLLSYFDLGGDAIPALSRELELRESVLRYLLIGVPAIPKGEQELSEAELSADFTVPEPPPDIQPALAPESAPQTSAEKPAGEESAPKEGKEQEEKTGDEGKPTPDEEGKPTPGEEGKAPEPARASAEGDEGKEG